MGSIWRYRNSRYYFSAHNSTRVHEQPASWDWWGLSCRGMTGDAGVRLKKRER